MKRVRMLRSIAHRLDLTEGRVCEVTPDEAKGFIAANLAELADAVDPTPPADTPNDPPAGDQSKAKARKPKAPAEQTAE